MTAHTIRTQDKCETVACAPAQKQGVSQPHLQVADNRTEAVQLRKLPEMANKSARTMALNDFQEMADNSPQAKMAVQLQAMADNSAMHQPVLPNPRSAQNNTGLPDNLKHGIESLSGHSMDDVRVHYNSDKPAQLNALAYAQGTDIHIAPGQQRHLPHEAWHVVQQKEGRVQPTRQLKRRVNINDDTALEKEADVMGTRAKNFSVTNHKIHGAGQGMQNAGFPVIQNKSNVVQRAIGFEFETGYPVLGKPKEEFVFFPFKTEHIVRGTNWHMVCDSGAAEFVTDPFPETSEGLGMLKTTMAEMASYALKLEGMFKDAKDVKKASGMENFSVIGKWWELPKILSVTVKGSERLGFLISKTVGGPVKYVCEYGELYMANYDGGMLASPQMTGGFQLDRIGKLFDKVSGAPTDGKPYENEIDIRGRTDNDVLKKARAATKAAAKDNGFDPEGKFGGFMNFVYLYLIYPDALYKVTRKAADYPKDMPLLSRTNMGLLAKGAITSDKELRFFQDLPLVFSYAGVTGNLTDPLFPGGYGNKSRTLPGPARRVWLEWLVNNRDWFAHAGNDNDCNGQAAMGSMDMGSRLVKADAHNPADRAIIELRRLQGPVHAGQWAAQAQRWFMLAAKVNTL